MTKTVYLLVLSGKTDDARRLLEVRYPSCNQEVLSKRALRENGWKAQLRAFRKLRGEALVIFSEAFSALKERQLLLCSAFVHSCRETVIASQMGELEVYTRAALFRLLPKLCLSAFLDLLTLLASSVLLRILLLFSGPESLSTGAAPLDIAYLYPFPLDVAAPGGAMTHVTGFLSGLAANSIMCEVFTGRTIPSQGFHVTEIPNQRALYLFNESQALSYNLRFAAAVLRQLARRRPKFLYQRHGRFVVAAAILSRVMSIPLVLEYNGSEIWVSKHWDPTRFSSLLRLCEGVCIQTAFLIVVVSDALRDELLQQGIAPERILVNPNGVDPSTFKPDRDRHRTRAEFGFSPDEVVACFVGSFSYWHGIPVLQRAIIKVMETRTDCSPSPKLRFLLVGDGALQTEMRDALRPYERSKSVVFTGVVPHDYVPRLLDAADILLSPHIPMPDNRPFFGSPTKLFEYMAMGKAIVASKLDQIGQILDHGSTAWLVQPGDADALASAIEALAVDPDLRCRLGQGAREAVVCQYSWRANAARVLECVLRDNGAAGQPSENRAAALVESHSRQIH